MGRRLIHGLSGAAVFLVSVALLSVRHRGAREIAWYPGLRGGMSQKAEQWSKVSLEREGGRRQEDQQVHRPEEYRTEKSLTLEDIFIAVKTTKRFHQSRMELLLDTWISRAKEQTYVFTDEEDNALKRRMGDHVIFTNCSAEHSHLALSCKMAAEFDAFLASTQSWFCHLDDDNYLNPQALLKLLSSYSATWDVYLGKPSLNRPIRASETLPNNQTKPVRFWFATGGAGFCISRKLASKMVPWASGRNFLITSEMIRLPDDCTVGYIIECKVGGHLLPNELFHSHLENLQLIPPSQLTQQVTISYGVFENKLNVIELSGPFSPQKDPSRCLDRLPTFLLSLLSTTEERIRPKGKKNTLSQERKSDGDVVFTFYWEKGVKVKGVDMTLLFYSSKCSTRFQVQRPPPAHGTIATNTINDV